MLASDRIVCCIPTPDATRARGFYEGILGLAVESDDAFALVLRGQDATLRLVKVVNFTPHPFTLMGWEVDDVGGTVRALSGRGVAFERYPGFLQDDFGIWTAPGGAAKVAWFKDPDGNLLSLTGH